MHIVLLKYILENNSAPRVTCTGIFQYLLPSREARPIEEEKRTTMLQNLAPGYPVESQQEARTRTTSKMENEKNEEKQFP